MELDDTTASDEEIDAKCVDKIKLYKWYAQFLESKADVNN